MTDRTTDRTTIDLDDAEVLISSRRSSMLMERDRTIDSDVLDRLAHLVRMAPNHKKTQPWRLSVFTGTRRGELGEAFRIDCIRSRSIEPMDELRLEKIRTKYLRAPAVMVVGCVRQADPLRQREDLMSVAAGVQNLLLGAAAAGLAALWSSPPVIVGETVARLAGFDPDTELVAVVYLGHPNPEQSSRVE